MTTSQTCHSERSEESPAMRPFDKLRVAEHGVRNGQVSVLFFGDQWDRRKRRRQQFASRIARISEVDAVLYVESPLPLTSLIKAKIGKADPDAGERWERVGHRGNHFRIDEIGLNVCTPRSFFRLTGCAHIDRLQRTMVRRCVVRSCRELWQSSPGAVRPVTIVTHPWLPLSFYRSLGLEIDCYDCTDDFTTFDGVPSAVRAMIQKNDEDLARTAGVVTCVSESLLKQKLQLNPNSHMVANGVDLELFEQQGPPIGIRKQYSIPDDAKILGYVGGVNKRVDTALLRTIVEERPNLHVAIAGTNTETDLHDVARIHLLGQLPLERIEAFLREVDVCLIPHKVNDLTQSMDPQKIYDYLAAGKPIVSTPVAGTERLPGLVRVASTKEDFIAAIEDAFDDGPVERDARLRAAAASSWQRRIEMFWELVLNSKEKSCEHEVRTCSISV